MITFIVHRIMCVEKKKSRVSQQLLLLLHTCVGSCDVRSAPIKLSESPSAQMNKKRGERPTASPFRKFSITCLSNSKYFQRSMRVSNERCLSDQPEPKRTETHPEGHLILGCVYAVSKNLSYPINEWVPISC